MPHPKARSNRRPRQRQDPDSRIVITPKGEALLTLLARFVSAGMRAQRAVNDITREHDRATPCAPKRGTNAPAPLPAKNAGTAGAPPAHPAGKSGAADRANDQEPTR